jgi:hypothetical protein
MYKKTSLTEFIELYKIYFNDSNDIIRFYNYLEKEYCGRYIFDSIDDILFSFAEYKEQHKI